MRKKNVVIVVADQWRADSVGHNGNTTVKTPNIDQLADEGVSFSNAYCQNPVCVPSRNSFLTGWYPHTKGFRTMHHLADEKQPNLLKSLKKSGYHVYWGGRNDFLKVDVDHSEYYSTRSDKFGEMIEQYRASKQNKAPETKKNDEPHDYSHYKGVKEDIYNVDGEQIKDAIQFLNDEAYGEDPFCVYLALSLPHPPYEVEKAWFDQIDSSKIDAPIRLTDEEWANKPSIINGIRGNQSLDQWSDEELKKLKQVYYAMGTKLDHYIGELIQTLKEKNLYEDTVIVFFSDHGDYTGDYEMAEKNQNTFEDVLTNVPLVIKPTGETKIDSRNTDAMVELIDVQATIHDLLDIEYTHTQFGKSLIPVLQGDEQHRDVVFCEGGRLESEQHTMDAGHTPSNEYWARTTEQEKMPQHTKAMMIRDKEYKYVYRLYEEDEFYHLTNDPFERNNQIQNPIYKDLVITYKDRMLKHFFETGDVVPFEHDSRF